METTHPTPKQPRRTRSEWQSIVEEHESSGLTAQEFCKQQGLAYQSLLKWRSVLSKTSQSSSEKPFIEITPQKPARQRFSDTDSTWDIELELGSTVTLRIRQGQ